jgi:hypothetical protein
VCLRWLNRMIKTRAKTQFVKHSKRYASSASVASSDRASMCSPRRYRVRKRASCRIGKYVTSTAPAHWRKTVPDSDSLLVDTTEGVATVILNRPDAYNAIDEDMLDRLPVILGELAADPAVRCVAITGTGDRAFCAGGDISSLGDAEVPDTDALIDRLESWAQASVLLPPGQGCLSRWRATCELRVTPLASSRPS